MTDFSMVDAAEKAREIAADPQYNALVEQSVSLKRVENFSLAPHPAVSPVKQEDATGPKAEESGDPFFTQEQFQLAHDKLKKDLRDIGLKHTIDLIYEENSGVLKLLHDQLPKVGPTDYPSEKDIKNVKDLVKDAENAVVQDKVKLIAQSSEYITTIVPLQALERVHAQKGVSDEQYQAIVEFEGKAFLEGIAKKRQIDLNSPGEARVKEALAEKIREDVRPLRPATPWDKEVVSGILDGLKNPPEKPVETPKIDDRFKAMPYLQKPHLTDDSRFREAALTLQSFQAMQPTGRAKGQDSEALDAKVNAIMEKAFGMDAVPGAAASIKLALKEGAAGGEDKSHIPNGDDWQKALGALKDYNERHPGGEGAAMNVKDIRVPGAGLGAAMPT